MPFFECQLRVLFPEQHDNTNDYNDNDDDNDNDDNDIDDDADDDDMRSDKIKLFLYFRSFTTTVLPLLTALHPVSS